MSRLAFDIETDGLQDTVTTIHSLVIKDIDTGKVMSCTDNDQGNPSVFLGLKTLSEADTIIGHNIVNYDIPVIQKLVPGWSTKATAIDTLLLSRLYKPEIRDIDFGRVRRGAKFPPKLIGSHSLEAWGYRLGNYKGDFGKTTDWNEWSADMQLYCEQDVEVTTNLYHYFVDYIGKWGKESLELEHAFAKIIQKQEQYGFTFDERAAADLYATLSQRRTELEAELKKVFPPIDKGGMFTPKTNNKTRGYVKGQPIWKPKLVEFNPQSRDHIAERLTKLYGWKPEVFTDTGKPQIDEEILSKMDYPEAKLLNENLMVSKRISQLAEGAQAWLKAIKDDGRIHGAVTTNGAVTGRCTHHHPNLAQVPSVGAPYGAECRALFGPPQGYYQLGCDASGLELRCLAHYLTKYDGGAYRDVILFGDIHTTNQQAAGLETRNEAKRFI